MSQQYPYNSQPHQAYQGGPAPYQPPPPPKKGMSAWAIVGIVIGGLFVFLIALGALVGDGEDKADAGKTSDRTAVAPAEDADAKPADEPAQKPAEKKAPAEPEKKKLTSAEEFKAFVAKNGTPTEKTAVKHVTKVQGAEEQNDILDSVDVYTDFTGGFMSKDQNQAKLIASAFADWKDSENGLVTVYGSDGDMISNGNF
ncbi:hypothetical protein [Streptomyces sp. NBC_00467]|uniref:hypothetical protein n=1 Tax=Streptomyces sp. NBC_00467 TaxID=2975752 RepID=UPI002E19E1B6